MNKKYTEEQIAFVHAHIKGRSYRELTSVFNEQFGMDINHRTMVSLAFRHGLRNERDCKFNTGWEPTQFKKGHVPFNKGKKGIGGWEPTQFKKGHRPANYRPVGSERTNVDGYVEIKVEDPGKWRPKHVVLWEATNGSVPKEKVLIFTDGNKQNISLENLLLISRRELAVMNKRGLISNDAELTKTGIVIADIFLKIGDRKRKNKMRSVY